MDRQGRNGGTLRSYEKGKSGNPGGRPKKKPDLIARLMAEMGDDWQDLEVTLIGRREGERPVVYHRRRSTDGNVVFHLVMAYRLIEMALAGNFEAYQIILDRTEGRVPAPINQLGLGNTNPLSVVFMTPTEDQDPEIAAPASRTTTDSGKEEVN